jgi:hypothetical protein
MTYSGFFLMLKLALVRSQNDAVLLSCNNSQLLPLQNGNQKIYWANVRIYGVCINACYLLFALFLESNFLNGAFVFPDCPELAATFTLLAYLFISLCTVAPLFWILQAELQTRSTGMPFARSLPSSVPLIHLLFFSSLVFSTVPGLQALMLLVRLCQISESVVILFWVFASLAALFPMLLTMLLVTMWWPVSAIALRRIRPANFVAVLRFLLTDLRYEEIETKSDEELMHLIEVAKIIGSVEVAEEISELLVSRSVESVHLNKSW